MKPRQALFLNLQKLIAISVITFTTVGGVQNSGAQSPSYAEAIVGTWEARLDSPSGPMTTRTTYNADGSFTQAGTLPMDGKQKVFAVSGKWELKGDQLKITAESSTLPDMLPKGFSQTDKILRMTATEMEVEQPTLSIRYVCKRVN